MLISSNHAMRGVFPVLPCIFDSEGEIDSEGLRNVLEYAIASGADGIVFPGLASEYESLTADERRHLVSLLATWIANRVPFIVGGSGDSLVSVAQHAAQAAQAQASAVMILTPPTLANDLAGMRDFFIDVGREAQVPIMLQNAPRPMGVGLSAEEIAKLVSEVPAIQYVKEETPPCGHRISDLLARNLRGLRGVFGGAGGRFIIDELNRGAAGTMPASEIVEIHVALVAAHRAGNVEVARELFERSLPLLSMQANFRWRLTKEVLRRRGLISSTFTRAPGPSLDSQDTDELVAMLQRLADLTGRLDGC